MKKKYERIEIHVKNAKIGEKPDAAIVRTEVYFDKNDVASIAKQTSSVFNKTVTEELADKLIENIPLYRVDFFLANPLNNIVLSDEQLAYLCE